MLSSLLFSLTLQYFLNKSSIRVKITKYSVSFYLLIWLFFHTESSSRLSYFYSFFPIAFLEEALSRNTL